MAVTLSGEQSPSRPDSDEPAPPCPSARSAPRGKPNHKEEIIELTVVLAHRPSNSMVSSMANSMVPAAIAQQLSSDTSGTQPDHRPKFVFFGAGDDQEGGVSVGIVSFGRLDVNDQLEVPENDRVEIPTLHASVRPLPAWKTPALRLSLSRWDSPRMLTVTE